jgi:hypothetical protein
LLEIIMTHFYFHVTIAYAILRHHGVEIGKSSTTSLFRRLTGFSRP